jgi:Serine carboxypeptidase S28
VEFTKLFLNFIDSPSQQIAKMFPSFFLLMWMFATILHADHIIGRSPLPIPVNLTSVGNQTLVPALAVDMPIDHFNEYDTRTYKNRYWIEDRYYQEGGPIFFVDAGEGMVRDRDILRILGENGTLRAPLRLAQRFNGMVVVWEHRFYGESLPFPLDNHTGRAFAGYEAYKYLNNEQALEDTIHFAKHFKPPGYDDSSCRSLTPSQTPWIWIGGSYSGARGAMIRVRNPDVFYATWASSAPVQAQIDMSVYYNPIQQSMPTNCSADSHAAVAYADNILLNGTPAEAAAVKQAILVASEADSYSNMPRADFAGAVDFDYYSMAAYLSYAFALTSISFQYFKYSGSLGKFCDYLESWSPVNATNFHINTTGTEWLDNAADRNFSTSGIAASFGAEQSFYAFLSATVFKLQADSRTVNTSSPPTDYKSWAWQQCSEFGYFQVSNTSNPASIVSRFNNITSYARNECKEEFAFAPDLPNVDAILRYGGYNMGPSNTMFTNGELDPWRTLGLQADSKINPTAIIRESTTDIPACSVPPEGNKIFGQVYPGEVHTADLAQSNTNRPATEAGFELFSSALEQWLECFGQ